MSGMKLSEVDQKTIWDMSVKIAELKAQLAEKEEEIETRNKLLARYVSQDDALDRVYPWTAESKRAIAGEREPVLSTCGLSDISALAGEKEDSK